MIANATGSVLKTIKNFDRGRTTVPIDRTIVHYVFRTVCPDRRSIFISVHGTDFIGYGFEWIINDRSRNTKNKVPIDNLNAAIDNRSTPIAKKSTPIAKKSTPIAKKSTPIAKKSTPIAN